MNITSVAAETVVALLCLGACSAPEAAEFSASTGTGGETSSGSTGDGCAADDFEVLGQCYRQEMFDDLLVARSVAVGDFDGDEGTELVMTCKGQSERFGICLLKLDGTIVRRDIDWLRSGDGQVHAGDFNDDGISDILVSEMYHFAVFSLEDGVFVEQSNRIYGAADDIELTDALLFPAIPIDVDSDGVSEIVTGSGFDGVRLWRFAADEERWVQSGERLPLFGCGDLQDAAVVDLDGDEAPEFLALGSHNNCDANLSPGAQWNRVSVFSRRPGLVELEPSGDFAAELPAQRFAVAALGDGDEAPDVVVAATANMMVFRGNGDHTFAAPVPLPGVAKFYGSGPHACDFDGDGIDELTVEQSGGLYHVLVGLPKPEVVALPETIRSVRMVSDLNGDGRCDLVSLSPEGEFPLILSLSQ